MNYLSMFSCPSKRVLRRVGGDFKALFFAKVTDFERSRANFSKTHRRRFVALADPKSFFNREVLQKGVDLVSISDSLPSQLFWDDSMSSIRPILLSGVFHFSPTSTDEAKRELISEIFYKLYGEDFTTRKLNFCLAMYQFEPFLEKHVNVTCQRFLYYYRHQASQKLFFDVTNSQKHIDNGLRYSSKCDRFRFQRVRRLPFQAMQKLIFTEFSLTSLLPADVKVDFILRRVSSWSLRKIPLLPLIAVKLTDGKYYLVDLEVAVCAEVDAKLYHNDGYIILGGEWTRYSPRVKGSISDSSFAHNRFYDIKHSHLRWSVDKNCLRVVSYGTDYDCVLIPELHLDFSAQFVVCANFGFHFIVVLIEGKLRFWRGDWVY